MQAAVGVLTYWEVLLEFFDMISMTGSGEEDSVAGSGWSTKPADVVCSS